MKAPTEKCNDTIQILVTRACRRQCSNCTQLLPFRQDTLHMSLDCFREAVRSLKGWAGIVGIFGGNPCIHPQFDEICRILSEEVPDQGHRGIWTDDLCGQGELIRETFYPHARFNLNPHANKEAAAEIRKWLPGKMIRNSDRQPSWHSAILVDWRDMGMTRNEWIAAREECDLNRNWSAAIVEHAGRPYAYFCEVAAAIDGVRGANNGILAEPGWWRKGMQAFRYQVERCCDAGCGVPLRIKGHIDHESVYDVSESWQQILPIPKGRIALAGHDGMPSARCRESTDYMRLRS